jgi:hypothetical protein
MNLADAGMDCQRRDPRHFPQAQFRATGAPIFYRLPCARHPVARIPKSKRRTEYPPADSAQNASAPQAKSPPPTFAIFPKRNSAPPERRYSIGYRARDILSPEF